MREPQKVEALRLPCPTASPVSDRPTSELDQPSFRRMQLQPELRQPFPELFQKPFGLAAVLQPSTKSSA